MPKDRPCPPALVDLSVTNMQTSGKTDIDPHGGGLFFLLHLTGVLASLVTVFVCLFVYLSVCLFVPSLSRMRIRMRMNRMMMTT